MAARNKKLVNEAYHAHPLRTQPALENIYAATDITERAARPASWHPSSHGIAQLAAPQQPLAQYPFPAYNEADFLTSLSQLPPTPVVYSAYNSPASVFSPLSLPYSDVDPQNYFISSPWPAAPQQAPVQHHLVVSTQQVGQTPSMSGQPEETPSSASSLGWNSAVNKAFEAPPTPEDFVRAPQPEPKLQSEETLPYQPLDADEPEGEILYGMGLYDAPEKPAVDSLLDYHQSTMSSLLGGSYEPTGKGLKLEDAWEPPESDDDDEDDDAEGEEQDDDE
jgi:hypothetical protein